MKKKFLFISVLGISLLISACGGRKKTTSSSSSVFSSYSNNYNVGTDRDYTLTPGSGYYSVSEVYNRGISSSQEGNIFYAWNWSLKNIKDNLNAIAEQGFTSIQISPLQPYKGYSSSDTADDYEKIYNPVSFSIAEENHSLGNKNDLISLCGEAEKYNIHILAEIVCNHLLGTSCTQLDPLVKEYEPDIYGEGGNYDEGALLHIGTTNKVYDESSYYTTHGSDGNPDLDTASSVVQGRVISLMQEYLDCGVNGFMFDDAKYIETPFDGPGDSSSFFPSILSSSTKYASSLGKENIYFYASLPSEIGKDRSLSWYSAMMTISDYETSSLYKTLMESNDYSSLDENYVSDQPGCKISLSSLNKDAFENSSFSLSDNWNTLVNIYALESSRKDANASILVPSADEHAKLSSLILGQVNSRVTQNTLINEINDFHNYFVSADENFSTTEDMIMNVRYDDEKCGLYLKSDSASVNTEVNENMKDGTYKDYISGNTFTVTNHVLSGELSSYGFGLIYNQDNEQKIYGEPSVFMSGNASFSSEKVTSEISVSNVSKAYLSVDGNTAEEVTDGAKITFGSDMDTGETITFRFILENLYGNQSEKTFSFTKVSQKEDKTTTSSSVSSSSASEENASSSVSLSSVSSVTSIESSSSSLSSEDEYTRIYFTNNKNWSQIYVYFWGDSETTSWPGETMNYFGKNEYNEDVYYFDINTSKYSYIIFSNGSSQTVNITMGGYNGYYILDTMDGSKYMVGFYSK